MRLLNQRGPSPFALQRRRGTFLSHNGQDNKPTRQGGTDTLKLYPLDVPPAQPTRRASQPRQPGRQTQPPATQARRTNNMAQQRPEYTMAPPQMPGRATPHAAQNPRQHTALSPTPQPQPQHSNMAMPHTAPNNPANMTPPQPPSPEQAAQHFRRTNKGLPDGVRFEPLDEETMRLLRDNGHLPPAPPATGQQPQANLATTPQPQLNPTAAQQSQTNPTPLQDNPVATQQPQTAPVATSQPTHHPSTPATPQPSTDPKTQNLTGIIQELIQDERNAHVFYSHLSKTAPHKPMADALSNIATDNTNHTHKLTQILTTQFNQTFEPTQAEINTGLELKDALTLALEEENRSQRILAELLETITNPESEKKIQHILNKKIVNYNQLERLLGW